MRPAATDPMTPRDVSPAPARRMPPLVRRRTADPAVKLWPRPVSGDDHDAVTPRRPRTRPGRWRRRRMLDWLKRLTLTLVLVGSPVAAALWLFHSPRFALTNVEIVLGDGEASGLAEDGSERVSEAWVRETVTPFVGDNLLRLSLSEIRDRLEIHPWVRSVGLSKELPSRLWVRVSERREVALLRTDHTLSFLDREGEIIAPVEGSPPPLVEIEIAAPRRRPQSALALLGELESAGPGWLGGLQKILVLGNNDFALSTTDLPYPLLVRGGNVADKVRYLRQLLPEIMAHSGAEAAIDLRFEQRIIILQPSAGRGAGGVLAERFAGTASGRHS